MGAEAQGSGARKKEERKPKKVRCNNSCITFLILLL